MAAMAKPWSTIGAWALETERAEAEGSERMDAGSYAKTMESFPTLNEAAASGEFSKQKKKKKKGIPLTLSEFTTGNYVGPGGARREPTCESKGLTAAEMLLLPTGPRERTDDELENSRLGGGFRSYGYGGDPLPRRVNEVPCRDLNRDRTSRADEVDNWASVKKPFSIDINRQTRSGFLSTSKADEVDNWASEKKAFAPPSRRHSGFGSGMHSDHLGRGNAFLSRNGERERPRLVLDPPKRDSESQQEPARSRPNPFAAARPREEALAEKGVDWRKMESEIEMKKTYSYSSRSSGSQSSRPGSSESKASEGGVAKLQRSRPNPFAAARPREEVLAEKGVDWRKMESEIEMKKTYSYSSRSSGSQSSRPGSSESKASEGGVAKLPHKVNPVGDVKPGEVVLEEKGMDCRKIDHELEHRGIDRPGSSDSKASDEGGVAKLRHKVNPFGDAKPREVVLAEKGMDWRKNDHELEHRGIVRPETDEEKKLKEEIDDMKKELCSQTEGNMNSDSLLGKIKEREKELENLIHELDDKVRFVQRASADNRPRSGSGRAAFSAEKPSLQNGISEGSRQTEFGSRGRSDSWSRPVSGRRGYFSSKDSGFLANRSMNRIKSGERW